MKNSITFLLILLVACSENGGNKMSFYDNAFRMALPDSIKETKGPPNFEREAGYLGYFTSKDSAINIKVEIKEDSAMLPRHFTNKDLSAELWLSRLLDPGTEMLDSGIIFQHGTEMISFMHEDTLRATLTGFVTEHRIFYSKKGFTRVRIKCFCTQPEDRRKTQKLANAIASSIKLD
ncbi:hypothetical protein F0L74_21815 [Chitinophaga agrisoli]|uniref:Gliding motility-associated lipoprotein GldD n=1 Tax=Chitinophaga agrisoli TaxID=2607653 RepID=A0A5B2VIW9_9BACT|nr:hypothetical protein [Chitinophaga agrisoli]KAA2238854.1 hypothetical protein F0L74_21815 [Chitinophaga agrisoli]